VRAKTPLARSLAAPLGAFGLVAGEHRGGVVLVRSRDRPVGQHQLLGGLIPLSLPGLVAQPGVPLPACLQRGLLAGDIAADRRLDPAYRDISYSRTA
jgi:hypothetical protein